MPNGLSRTIKKKNSKKQNTYLESMLSRGATSLVLIDKPGGGAKLVKKNIKDTTVLRARRRQNVRGGGGAKSYRKRKLTKYKKNKTQKTVSICYL